MSEVPPHPGVAAAFRRLAGVVDRLRGPDGCPWDREQTIASARRYLLEEAYEALEALEAFDGGGSGAVPHVLEELADLLFQVAFLARLFAETGAFDLARVADRAAEKMIGRHPHVFGDRKLETKDEVVRKWSDLKAQERGESAGLSSLLDGVPRALPALARALVLTERASRAGFDWPDALGPLAKLDEERAELAAAIASGERASLREELGDLLLTAANLARKLGLDPEEALQLANRKFDRRFRFVEAGLRARPDGAPAATLAEMDALWDEAKRSGL